jgi:hypothetical protein
MLKTAATHQSWYRDSEAGMVCALSSNRFALAIAQENPD